MRSDRATLLGSKLDSILLVDKIESDVALTASLRSDSAGMSPPPALVAHICFGRCPWFQTQGYYSRMRYVVCDTFAMIGMEDAAPACRTIGYGPQVPPAWGRYIRTFPGCKCQGLSGYDAGKTRTRSRRRRYCTRPELRLEVWCAASGPVSPYARSCFWTQSTNARTACIFKAHGIPERAMLSFTSFS